MEFAKKNGKGLLLCLGVAIPAWFAGKIFPVAGGAVIAIMAGMIITMFIKDKSPFMGGIHFSSKKNIAVGRNSIGLWSESPRNTQNRKRVTSDYRVHNHDFTGDCLCFT